MKLSWLCTFRLPYVAVYYILLDSIVEKCFASFVQGVGAVCFLMDSDTKSWCIKVLLVVPTEHILIAYQLEPFIAGDEHQCPRSCLPRWERRSVIYNNWCTHWNNFVFLELFSVSKREFYSILVPLDWGQYPQVSAQLSIIKFLKISQ